MTLNEIYAQFTIGSTGFVNAVSSHCGFDTSRDETKRIAEKAPTAEDFQRIWENEDWWIDAKH